MLEKRNLSIALAGIDGAGKSSAAKALASRLRDRGMTVEVTGVYGGRKNMDNLARRFGTTASRILGIRGMDFAETLVRAARMAHATRLMRRGGLLILDRSFHCQQALRRARRLPGPGLAGLLELLFPGPDAVVFFEIDPQTAFARIRARGTDVESLEDLAALDAGYRQLETFGDFITIDAAQSPDRVADQLEQEVLRLLGSSALHPPLDLFFPVFDGQDEVARAAYTSGHG